MRHALAIGSRNLGRVWPNPAVGCVLVNQGRIVGRGWTGLGGTPHAETRALDMAGSQASGATAYVTLEPCSHHGKTPPCADALIAAGIARVVIAVRDPNEQVNGQGADRLRAAGIDVDIGVLTDQASDQHRGFFSRIRHGVPSVTLKLAASLDGRIATGQGESKWITGPGARKLVHAMRANHDAVMVGGGTARVDDPRLDIRDLGIDHRPGRIVWSSRLDLPLDNQLAKTAGESGLWILHSDQAPKELCAAWSGLGARLLACPAAPGGGVLPAAALEMLGQAGLTRVFCEGGGQLAASLLGAGLVDRLVCFSAGTAIGAEGQPMLGAMGVGRLAQAPRFRLITSRAVQGDLMSCWLAEQSKDP